MRAFVAILAALLFPVAARAQQTGTAYVPAPPQTTVEASGSGTYTTPLGARYLIVTMFGPGGPGSGGGTTPGNGTASASDTTFGTSLLTAAKGAIATGTTHGNGGAATGCDQNITGQNGNDAASGFTFAAGGFGGGGGFNQQNNATPPAPPVNSGLGGAGGAAQANASPGAGGGQGAKCIKQINGPLASYSYNVGPASTGGTTGTGGNAGVGGASGEIIVTAYF